MRRACFRPCLAVRARTDIHMGDRRHVRNINRLLVRPDEHGFTRSLRTKPYRGSVPPSSPCLAGGRCRTLQTSDETLTGERERRELDSAARVSPGPGLDVL